MERQLEQLDEESRDYTLMQGLQQSEAERQGRLEVPERKLAELATSPAQSTGRYQALDRQLKQRQQDLSALR